MVENTRRRIFNQVMVESYGGVAMSGGVFGSLLALLSLAGVPAPRFGDSPMVLVVLLFGFAFGALLASFVSLCVGACVVLFLDVARATVSPEFAATTAGGLTGFVLLTQLAFGTGNGETLTLSGYFYGPFLAMAFGQLGASYSAHLSVAVQIESQRKSSGLSCDQITHTLYDKSRQFSLRLMAVAALVVAILLAGSKLAFEPQIATPVIGLIITWMLLTAPMAAIACRLTEVVIRRGNHRPG